MKWLYICETHGWNDSLRLCMFMSLQVRTGEEWFSQLQQLGDNLKQIKDSLKEVRESFTNSAQVKKTWEEKYLMI